MDEFKASLLLQRKVVLLDPLQLLVSLTKTKHFQFFGRNQVFVAYNHRHLMLELIVSGNALIFVPAHELIEDGSEFCD